MAEGTEEQPQSQRQPQQKATIETIVAGLAQIHNRILEERESRKKAGLILILAGVCFLGLMFFGNILATIQQQQGQADPAAGIVSGITGIVAIALMVYGFSKRW